MSRKLVLVTGCSDGGLGSALAIAFQKAGCRVFATARNPAKMSEMKASGIEILVLDVTSLDSIKSCADEVRKLADGTLDVLVNNAGRGYSMPICDVKLEEMRRLFETNLYPIVTVTQGFLPLLLKAKGGGLIVNNTSVCSVLGVPMEGIYNASKGAVALLSETMRIEMATFNIKVVDMKTGAVESRIDENQILGPDSLVPESSLFSAGRDALNAAFSGDALKDGDERMPRHQWAKTVVSRLLKRNPPLHLWAGTYSALIWIVTRLLPVGAFNSYLRRKYEFPKLVGDAPKTVRQGCLGEGL
ncbi:1-acylglycerone phosphate reductase [Cadophora sp. DSE1049]|nr:1-acylglycerone phosphate reductase [Cadophora sp. DSE1049]